MWRKTMEYHNDDFNIKNEHDTYEVDKEVENCYFEKMNTKKINNETWKLFAWIRWI